MKTKVSEATGPVLDWMVAKCEGLDVFIPAWAETPWLQLRGNKDTFCPSWSTNWSQGGPIIEREGIFPTLTDIERHDDGQVTFDQKFRARTPAQYLDHDEGMYGPTPLIAAMRCYVTSKLGDEVEVPDELAQI